jgi:hypothetical protein
LNRVKGIEENQDLYELDDLMEMKIVDFDEEKAIRNVCSSIIKSFDQIFNF